jgi:predicted DNA-binding transcriptional regulator AlpA
MGEVVAFNRAELQVVREAEAAAVMGISEATLRRLRINDIGPRHVQLSTRRIGYRVPALRQWLAERERGGGSVKVAA